MISLSEADILAWVTPLLWPFLRVLALFTALPVLGTRNVPARLRIGLAILIALAMQPSLPPCSRWHWIHRWPFRWCCSSS
jgi:flagellar biosynthetic protein FliR